MRTFVSFRLSRLISIVTTAHRRDTLGRFALLAAYFFLRKHRVRKKRSSRRITANNEATPGERDTRKQLASRQTL
jgi:hypothetical protein